MVIEESIPGPGRSCQEIATAIAINVCRLHDWVTGISPHTYYLSRFMKEAA